MEELENAGIVENTEVETASTDVNDVTTENSDTNTSETESVKTFTQEQVNEFVRNRIDRERNTTWKRYGVANRNELDTLVAKSQSYDAMKERYENIQNRIRELEQEIAFTRLNIDPTKQDDVLVHFKGKELEFNENNLMEELRTHPEWLKPMEASDKPTFTFTKIGADRPFIAPKEDEKDIASKLFNLKEII